tara:strand:- start:234 stop:467 length:234 start_codon:yes stop_codon:yes gene_type:complete
MEGNTRDVGPSVKPGVFKKTFEVNINGTKTKLVLNIWDTPGADEFGNMLELDYKGADVAVMVYSIDKDTTFVNVNNM